MGLGAASMAANTTKAVIHMKQHHYVLIAIIVFIGLLYLLAPILPPFLLAALLAYLVSPAVGLLQRWHMPRIAAVSMVLLLLVSIIIVVPLLLIPLLQEQFDLFMTNLPQLNTWLQQTLLPTINQYLPISNFDLNNLTQLLSEHWSQAGGYAATVWKALSSSSITVVTWLFYLVLIPLVTFYFLRDGQAAGQRTKKLLPRSQSNQILRLWRDCNAILGAFLRGQLLVIIAMTILYSIGLKIIGLEFALLLGIFAGITTVIPYVGVMLSIVVTCIAALVQFHDSLPMLYVLLVFAIGIVIENFIAVPYLVGDQVGLHPLIIIFVVLAGGQLFGFLGVLLALPFAAVAKVLMRELQHRYLHSHFYKQS